MKTILAITLQQLHFIHYHTMPHFDTLKIYGYGKHCEKRRKCLLQAISPFLIMLPTIYGTYFSFLNALQNVVCNLNQSKILSSGNGYDIPPLLSTICCCNFLPNKKFLHLSKLQIFAANYSSTELYNTRNLTYNVIKFLYNTKAV